MKQSTKQWIVLIAVLALAIFVGGCKKKAAPAPPTPPPPPKAPTASLTVNPDTITQGESATLGWNTTDATDVTIDNGVGAVQPSGSQQITPTESTTYTLTAKGPGGTQSATARITVKAKEVVQPPPPKIELTDIYFDYDKYDIRADQQSAVQQDAAALKQDPTLRVVIEGNCDERGSSEYNLTLGDNRANSAKQALLQAGVNPAQIVNVISYGKEKPVCTEHTEDCWQKNRRAHLEGQK